MDGILDLDIFEESTKSNDNNVDDILSLDIGAITESEIHGKAPTPSATGPTKHSGPTANKIEITSDVYNQAVADIKKSFNESLDILSRCVVVESTTNEQKKTLNEKMNEIYENAIIDAFLEAADNGPIYEAVEKKGKEGIKKTVLSIRKELSSKLDDSFHFAGGKTALRNIEIIITQMVKSLGSGIALAAGADYLLSALNRNLGITAAKKIRDTTISSTAFGGAVGAITVLSSNYTWQTVGSICINPNDAKKKLDEIKEITSEHLKGNEKLHCIKVNKTITENIISKFKYKLSGGVLYLLIVDDQPPKELTILSKPLKEVKIKEKDKKESDDKENKKDDKNDDKNINESYELVFDTSDDITDINI